MRRLALALAAAACFGCGGPPVPELFVYTWADYLPDEVVRDFEKEAGCRVVVSYYASVDELQNKLLGGAL